MYIKDRLIYKEYKFSLIWKTDDSKMKIQGLYYISLSREKCLLNMKSFRKPEIGHVIERICIDSCLVYSSNVNPVQGRKSGFSLDWTH